ncbi:MAG: HNH endonuclease signature motif containing protein [Elusimicrobiota bacterium]|nr:HNH endonuclease signature motif containing protein [Elusimicrobiota bacterium]
MSRLDSLVHQERESLTEIVEHLMEVDRREAALDRGYPSLFTYCVNELGYSEGAAYLRIRAARAASAFPDVLDRLRAGRIHLEGIARLYPHLTNDNAATLLDIIDGASKREIISFVATLQPEPAPERDVIVPVQAPTQPVHDTSQSNEPPHARVIPPPNHRFHFTGDHELLSMIERLRGLLRHKYPDGRLESILKEATRTLLNKLERDRSPSLTNPHRSNAAGASRPHRIGSRVIPRTIKRAVWARDDGRCAFLAPDGRRCESRDALEYDHVVPWADGGRSDTTDNVRLLCRAHNQRHGRRRFGPRRRLC